MEGNGEIVLRIEDDGGRCALRVAGALSIATAGELRRALLEGLHPAGLAVLDLSAVTSADLSGLQLLYAARQSWRRAGAELKLEGTPDWLGRMAAEAGCEVA